jgi:hypothetical protein
MARNAATPLTTCVRLAQNARSWFEIRTRRIEGMQHPTCASAVVTGATRGTPSATPASIGCGGLGRWSRKGADTSRLSRRRRQMVVPCYTVRPLQRHCLRLRRHLHRRRLRMCPSVGTLSRRCRKIASGADRTSKTTLSLRSHKGTHFRTFATSIPMHPHAKGPGASDARPGDGDPRGSRNMHRNPEAKGS